MATTTFVLTYALPTRRLIPLILATAAAVVLVAYGQFPIQKVLERQTPVEIVRWDAGYRIMLFAAMHVVAYLISEMARIAMCSSLTANWG